LSYREKSLPWGACTGWLHTNLPFSEVLMAAKKKKAVKKAKKKAVKKAKKKAVKKAVKKAKKKVAKKAKKKAVKKAKKKVAKKAKKKVAKKAKKKAVKKAKKKVAKKAKKKVAKKAVKKAKKKVAKKAKKKRKPNAAFMKPVTPDAALAAVVGAKPLPRTMLTKKLWAYIKKNGLQDKKNRRMINADDKLKPVFKNKAQVSMFEMTKLVSGHVK
jgi:upstream activation factor subunit UAF30